MLTKGPILVVTAQPARAERLRALLAAERFDTVWATTADAALALATERGPTVVVIDWSLADEGPLHDLLHALRPRRAGPRIVALATAEERPAAAALRGLLEVLDARIDVEALVDLVWRLHHEVTEARDPTGG